MYIFFQYFVFEFHLPSAVLFDQIITLIVSFLTSQCYFTVYLLGHSRDTEFLTCEKVCGSILRIIIYLFTVLYLHYKIIIYEVSQSFKNQFSSSVCIYLSLLILFYDKIYTVNTKKRKLKVKNSRNCFPKFTH